MAGRMPLTGLVLAGGTSSRMGEDKLLLPLDGRRLIDHACDALSPICQRVLVAPRDGWIPGLSFDEVDDADGEGPLAGIVGGLRAAKTPLVAVIGGDMPLVSAALLKRLAALWNGEPAIAPSVDGVVQPLHAIYATAAAEDFAKLLADGERSPLAALNAVGARVMTAEEYDPDGIAGEFWTNVNSPDDLARLEARHTAE